MCICLFWQGPFLVKVFIVGSCFPGAGRCLCCLWCCVDPRILWPGFLHTPSWKWLKTYSKSACGGLWGVFCGAENWDDVLYPCWAGCVSLHPTPRCFQLWCARSSWAERGMQQDEAPLPLLFCWEMSPGSCPLGSGAGVFAVSLGDYRSQR